MVTLYLVAEVYMSLAPSGEDFTVSKYWRGKQGRKARTAQSESADGGWLCRSVENIVSGDIPPALLHNNH
jgi:hypothetical protein